MRGLPPRATHPGVDDVVGVVGKHERKFKKKISIKKINGEVGKNKEKM
jgi:hypothetical protein